MTLLTAVLLNTVVSLMLVVPEWNFEADTVGGLPAGWQTHGDDADAVYRIETDPDGNHYVAARSRSSDVQLGVTFTVKAEQFPVLSWRWRVWELPSKADERAIR